MQSGKIRQIAVTSKGRFESLKDLPSIAESGIKDFEAVAWNGLLGRRRCRPTWWRKINADVNAAPGRCRREGAHRQRRHGAWRRQSAASFKPMLDADMKKWGGIIKRLNIQLD